MSAAQKDLKDGKITHTQMDAKADKLKVCDPRPSMHPGITNDCAPRICNVHYSRFIPA